MEDFIKCRIAFSSYLCTIEINKRQMIKTEQQKEATRFCFDYFQYLLHQEGLVERMVERKMNQLEPQIEQLVNKKIDQRIQYLINNK